MAGIHMQWLLKVTAQTNVPFQVKLHIRLYSGLFKYKIPTKILQYILQRTYIIYYQVSLKELDSLKK